MSINDKALQSLKKPQLAKENNKPTKNSQSSIGTFFQKFVFIEWKFRILFLLGIYVFFSYFVLTDFLIEKTSEELFKEAYTRAQVLVKYLAERNALELKLNNDILLDTESVLQESGVVEASIADKSLRVRAPLAYSSSILNDQTSREALIESKVITDFPKNIDVLLRTISHESKYDFAYSIRVWNDETGGFETIGIAKIVFSPQEVIQSHFNIEEMRKKAIIILLIPLFLIFLGIYFSTILPIRKLRQSVENAAYTDTKEISQPCAFDELQKLAESIQSSITTRSFAPQTSSLAGAQEGFGITQEDAQSDARKNIWHAVINKLEEGIIIVDNQKVIEEVNHRAVEMLKLIHNGGVGEPINTIITDQDVIFAMNDLIEKIQSNQEESPSFVVNYGGPGRRLHIKAFTIDKDTKGTYIFLFNFTDYGT